jgi:hypothetical protein
VSNVYGNGFVDLGQPGSKQGQGKVQTAQRGSVNRGRSREGECLINGNLHLLDGDLPETVGALAMVSPRLPGGEDEQEQGSGVESEWATGRGFERGLELINRSSELGLGWFPLDAIGRRGQCFRMASCAESRDVSSCIGGVLVRSENGRFQWLSRENGVRLGHCGAPRGWARLS